MADVVMYTSTYCGYCRAAKALLSSKGVAYEEINLDEQPGRRAEMVQRAEGRTTVPQIFIGGKGVGGFDDISELDYEDKLDGMLGIAD